MPDEPPYDLTVVNEAPYDLVVEDGAYTLTLSGLGAQGIPGPAIATELEVTVRNQSGAPMTKGTIVYLDGSTGQRPLIEKAQANNDANSAQTIGFLKDAINNNADGVVIVSGLLENINTQGLGDGTQLYLSPTTAGTWTTTKPSAPNHLVYVGIVVKDHITQGVIYVSVQNGYELNELHDVAISSPATGQFLKRNAGNTLWVNSSIVSADVTDATNAATAGTIVKRNGGGSAAFGSVTANTFDGNANAALVTLGGSSNFLTISNEDGTTPIAYFECQADTAATRYYTFPGASGTVILNSTLGAGVNGLTTITGAKSFSGQVQLTGQSVTDANSAMTRGLADARYLGQVTPASIAAAIETATEKQDADIRDSLELLPRDLHLRGLRNTIDIASTLGAIPISIIQLGDSFSDFAVFNRGARVVGAFRCNQATGGGDSGVTQISDDYARSPDGRYSQIASGGNLTAAHLTSGTQGPASHVHYTLFPGTGTAQLQFSNNGGAWTNVGSAINTATITNVSIGSIALPNAWQNIRTRVTATGGTVNGWIGQGLSGPGVTLMNFGVTGQGVQQSATVSEAIWKAMVAGYQWAGGAEIVFVTFADARFAEGASGTWAKGAPLWAQNGPLDTLYQWSKTANSTVDWMVVGPHQVDPARNDTADATLDPLYAALGIGLSTNERIKDGARAQRDWSLLRSEGFVDCIPLLPNYAAANADGMYDDQIHLNLKGEAFKRAWVWRSSNMGFVLGDAGYNSSVRVGDGYLAILAGRATGALPQVSGLSTAAIPALLPAVFAELRSGDPVAPEQAGLAFRCTSTNVGRISTYNQSSHTDLLEYTLSGASPLIQPVTSQTIGNATLQTLLGTTSRRYADVVTTGLNVGHRAVTAASVTVVQADHTIFADATSNAITVNLPAAASHAGRVFAVVKTDASGNAVTLDPNASETIDGAGTLALLTQWSRCQIQSNGTNWIRIA